MVNLSRVSPYLTLVDVLAGVDFYRKAFDFRVGDLSRDAQGTILHAEVMYYDQLLMFGKQGAHNSPLLAPVTSHVPSPITLYLYCDNVDQFHLKAVTAGAISLASPEDMFWGDRMCRLQCPDGYVWCFATRLKK